MYGFRARSFLASLALLLLASPAFALSGNDDITSPPPPPDNPLLEVICFNARTCQQEQLPDMGMDFLYSFGGRPTAGGLDISIRTTGSLFVVGPVGADELILEARDVFLTVPDIEFPILEPVKIDPPIICACVEAIDLGSGAGLFQLGDRSGDGSGLVQPVGGQEPPTPTPLSLNLVLEGDVFLDLSEFEHNRIDLFAKKKIVIVTSTVVPEPGTALLMGLGLLGLATTRRN